MRSVIDIKPKSVSFSTYAVPIRIGNRSVLLVIAEILE